MAIDQETARSQAEPAWDRGLDIRERRAWRTWQLATAIAIAFVVGMAVGNTGAKGESSATADKPLYSLPPDAGGSPSTLPSSAARTAIPSEHPAAAGSLRTGPVTTLLSNRTGSGSGRTTTFATGGQWKLGWAFDCSLAQNGQGNLSMFVVPDGGPAPAQATITRSGSSANGVATLGTLGKQFIRIVATNGCRWAVKATGVAG